MKKTWREFIGFISKGNVIDLAVAIMLGAAFQKIVSSLVNDMFMPLIGWLVKTDLSQWFITLQPGVANLESESQLLNPPSGWVVAPIRLQFGLFVQSLIDFFLVAVLLFAVVKFFQLSKKVRLDFKQNQSKKVTRNAN